MCRPGKISPVFFTISIGQAYNKDIKNVTVFINTNLGQNIICVLGNVCACVADGLFQLWSGASDHEMPLAPP